MRQVVELSRVPLAVALLRLQRHHLADVDVAHLACERERDDDRTQQQAVRARYVTGEM